MLAKTETIAILGTEARIVEVEVDVHGGGIPCLAIVGLPTKSVREAEHRVHSAMVVSGIEWPRVRKVANLAPGELPKDGSHFDLPIALGILAARGAIPKERLDGWIVVGELALDGSVRPIRGTLAAAIECRSARRRGLICPAANAAEAAAVDGIEVAPVESLMQCISLLRGEWEPPRVEVVAPPPTIVHDDLRDVKGHTGPKEALEVAAAGAHNLLMCGPPGAGKTMLARRLPGILPPMSPEESLAVTRIYSVAGRLGRRASLVTQRPFRTPHHGISMPGLVGGGSGLPKPGEISLAHHGVLFLDELPLYRYEVLEALRGPVEDGFVRVARSRGSVSFQCRFSLIAAMNPCPCGYLSDTARDCTCKPARLERYDAKISGPLLDRFDMRVEMSRLGHDELLGEAEGESSADVRARVCRARALQTERYGSSEVTNASVPHATLKQTMRLTPDGRAALAFAIENSHLTGRGTARVLRVARTIADLCGSDVVDAVHVGRALVYRLDQRKEKAA